MTNDEMRIAIAEAVGYERLVIGYESLSPMRGLECGPDGIWRTSSANKWLRQIEEQDVQCVGDYFVRLSDKQIFADFDGPDNGVNGRGQFDYPNDLNAMHEAEKTLLTDLDLSLKYDRLLAEITSHFTWHATATQRAEAFLRTIGKRKE